jgi:hypothetical protein
LSKKGEIFLRHPALIASSFRSRPCDKKCKCGQGLGRPDIAVYARHQAGPGCDVLACNSPRAADQNPVKIEGRNFRIVNRSFTPGVEMLTLQKETEK